MLNTLLKSVRSLSLWVIAAVCLQMAISYSATGDIQPMTAGMVRENVEQSMLVAEPVAATKNTEAPASNAANETAATRIELYDRVRQATMDRATKIDISDLHLENDVAKSMLTDYANTDWVFSNDLARDLTGFYYETQSMPHADGTSTLISMTLKPDYNHTDEEMAARMDATNAVIDEITAPLEGMSQTQKARIMHDWLTVNVEYDDDKGDDASTAYGALVNRKAICGGYSVAYAMLCAHEGIECHVVTGKGRNAEGEMEGHAWNIVVIDGHPYHVDVTWDRGTWDIDSQPMYFMRTEEYMLDHGHYDIFGWGPYLPE